MQRIVLFIMLTQIITHTDARNSDKTTKQKSETTAPTAEKKAAAPSIEKTPIKDIPKKETQAALLAQDKKAVVQEDLQKEEVGKTQEVAEEPEAQEKPKKLSRTKRTKLKRDAHSKAPVQHAAIKRMTLQELGPAKERYLKQNQKHLAASCLERMITLENDQYKQHALRLELANLYMDLEKYVAAGAAYQSLITLYPNSSDIELVYYRSTQCAWQETLTHDRDQTKTKACLEVVEKYLKNETYKKYRTKVEQIAKQCYKKLIDHEGTICKFYLKKGKVKGAEQRIAYVKDEYLPNYADGQRDILVLECELAKTKKNHEEYAQKSTALAQQPAPTKLAPIELSEQTKQPKTKKRYAKRF